MRKWEAFKAAQRKDNEAWEAMGRARPLRAEAVYVVYLHSTGVGLRRFGSRGAGEAFVADVERATDWSDEPAGGAADVALARQLAVPLMRAWHANPKAEGFSFMRLVDHVLGHRGGVMSDKPIAEDRPS